MKDIIYEVLKLIEENNFEAYIVGGFVRDKILGKNSKDVDIITNAKPKDLLEIFKTNIKLKEDYGAVKLLINDYNIDITTYRKDYNYVKNKPTSVEYINEVKEDLIRRDFTMNTLLMDKEGKIYDFLLCKKDITSKKIKVVGNIDLKFEEDKTRILRAIRFMITLGFKLDDQILDYINKNKDKLKEISFTKKKEELEKIFVSNNINKFINFIKKYDIEESLGIKFNNFVKTPAIIGLWAQIEFDEKYCFNSNELKQIQSIRYLINKGKIDEFDLYKYDNFICINAAYILKLNINKINKIYTSLPIKGIIDINITCNEICNILNIKPCKKVSEIYKILEKDILYRKVKNNKLDLIKYIQNMEK